MSVRVANMVHSTRKKPKKSGKKRFTVLWKYNVDVADETFDDNYELVGLFIRAFESFDRITEASKVNFALNEDENKNGIKVANDEDADKIANNEDGDKIADHLLYFIKQKLSSQLVDVPLDEKQKIQENIHSILFYSVLKNFGFECKEADEYYEVLEGGFSQITWPLYLQLVRNCHLDCFFMQSMLQVPSPVVAFLLRETFSKLLGKLYDNDLVLCHLIFQILIMKIFDDENESSAMPFGFPFLNVKPASVLQDGDPEIDLNKIDVFKEVVQATVDYFTTYHAKRKLAPILLNGLIIVIELLINRDDDELHDTIVILEKLRKCLIFINDFFQDEEILNFLKAEFESFDFFQFVPKFTMKQRYEWHCSYLIFLTHVKWIEAKEIFDKENSNETFQTINKTVEFLFSHHPLNNANYPIVEKYIPLMISQIKMKLEGFDFAIDFFFKNDEFLKRTEVLSCLKEIKFSVNKKPERYFQLMKAAFTATSPERETLFYMFIDWYEHSDLPLKKELMKTRVSEYTLSIKTSSFDQDILNFTNFASESQDEIISKMLYLCMQSVEDTIERIIDEFVNYGIAKLPIIEGLKDIPYVCSYRKPTDNGQLPILIEALKPHFKSTNKSQILLILIKTLIEIFPDPSIFPRNHFVNSCIMDSFSSVIEETDVRFYCQVLHIVLSEALSSGDSLWLNSISISLLIEKLAVSLHWTICHSDISVKDDILEIFSILLNLKRKTYAFENFNSIEFQQRFMMFLETKHRNVKFYVLDFLIDRHVDVAALSLDGLLSYCIICNDHVAFSDYISHCDNLPYQDIVAAVAEVFSYFSSEEVITLLSLLKILNLPQHEVEENEAPSDDRRKLVYCVKIFSDAIHSINSSKPVENVILHNFSGAINSEWMNICSSVFTFKEIFLEITKLSQCLPNHSDIFNGTLLMFAEEFDWVKIDASTREELSKDVIGALEKLHDGDCRTQLIKLFTIPEKKTVEENSL